MKTHHFFSKRESIVPLVKRSSNKHYIILFFIVLFRTAAFGQTYPSFNVHENGTVIYVSDYGAFPNDSIDDEDQINAAINAADDSTVIMFAAGVYNLRSPNSDSRFTSNSGGHIYIMGKNNITLLGAVDSAGEPATHIERELEYTSTGYLPAILYAKENNGIKIANMTFTNNQLHYAVGKVLAKGITTIRVEVLEGYPVDDNCPVTAANIWTWDPDTQLEGEEKLKMGVPSFTYGSTDLTFEIATEGPRQMRVTGVDPESVNDVDVGDYISWHYGFSAVGSIYFMVNRNIYIENVHIYSAMRSSLFFGYNENVYGVNLEIRPENGRFSMAGRDGIHASRNTGEFVFDSLYVKGTRMDAFVATGTAAEVYSITDSRHFQFRTDQSLAGGNNFGVLFGDGNGGFEPGYVCKLRPISFYSNGIRHKVEIDSVSHEENTTEGTIYNVVTSEDIPAWVTLNNKLVAEGLTHDTVIIRNSKFESIAGSSQILFCDNVLSTNNVHENIMYAAVRFGANPSRNHTGANLIVSNSSFYDCAWEVNYDSPNDEINEYGCINSFNASTTGYQNMDIANLLIEDNYFESNYSASGRVGIIIDEAQDITIRNNTFSGFNQDVEFRDVNGVTTNDSSQIESGAIYRLENQYYGNYLRGYDQNSSNTSGNNAYITNYADTPSWSTQKWIITEDTTNAGYYFIKNVYSDRFIRGWDPNSNPETADNANVTVYDYRNWATQKWQLIPVPGQPYVFYIKNVYSGNYLRGDQANNSYVTQTSSSATTDICWRFYKQEVIAAAILENDATNIKQKKNNELIHELIISPNPAKDLIRISGHDLEGKKVEIYNIMGKIVFNDVLQTFSNAEIDIRHVKSGVYILMIKNDVELIKSVKFVIQ